MDYAADYQQQETGHMAYQNSSNVDIESLSWVKFSVDLPWIIRPF